MSSMLFLILTALAFMSVSVQCFMALPTSKTINKVASKISKETRLFDKIHDLAAAGDLEYIMDAVSTYFLSYLNRLLIIKNGHLFA